MAWLLTFIVALDGTALALPALHPATLTNTPLQIMQSIPSQLGTVQAWHDAGTKRPLVIHIQDAHCNYLAQTNIAGLLDYVASRNITDTVLMEGAEGKVDARLFSAHPDISAKKEIFKPLLASGALSGTEYYAVLGAHPIQLHGAETKPLYDTNKQAYLEAALNRGPAEEILERYEQQLQTLKEAHYVPELHQLDALSRREAAKKISLLERWRRLIRLYPPLESDLSSKYLNLTLLHEASTLRVRLKASEADKRARTLFETWREAIASPEAVEKLIHLILDYNSKRDSAAGLLERLRQLSEETQFSLVDYDDLVVYLESVVILENIVGPQLFQELRQAEAAIRAHFLTTDEQRIVHTLSERLLFLRKLFGLELTPQEWTLFNLHAEDYSQEHLDQLLARLSPDSAVAKDALNKLMQAAVKFYTAATDRDDQFFEQINARVRHSANQTLVFVSGGFHTPALEASLRAGDYSYVVLQPRVDVKQGHANYERLMREAENLEAESALESDLQPSVLSLYSRLQLQQDTFVKRLLGQGSAGDWMLNLLRARDFAGAGKVRAALLKQAFANMQARGLFSGKGFEELWYRSARWIAAGLTPQVATALLIDEAAAAASLGSEAAGLAPFGRDNIGGRGFLGGAYRMPSNLVTRVLKSIKKDSVTTREIGGVTFKIVEEIETSANKLSDGRISEIESVAFIAYGYPFYSLWDKEGNVYITKNLADHLGLFRWDDAELSELVMNASESFDAGLTAISQLWLYWKVKIDLLKGRQLTETEQHLARIVARQGITPNDVLANIIALLQEIRNKPDDVFRRAWNDYYNFPESQGLDLSHLSAAQIDELSAKRKARVEDRPILTDLAEKRALIDQWLAVYREGRYDELDGLSEAPDKVAVMLHSFLAEMGVPHMDQFISLIYDHDINNVDQFLNDMNRSQYWQHQDGVNAKDPEEYLKAMLKKEASDPGKLLVLGVSPIWWQNEKMRALFESLVADGSVNTIIMSQEYAEVAPLYKEFDLKHVRYLKPENAAQGKFRPNDAENLALMARPILENASNVLIVVPVEESFKRALHWQMGEGLYAQLKAKLKLDKQRIFSVAHMRTNFGGHGYFLRGRRNVLIHEKALHPALIAVDMNQNPDLSREPILPGNHFIPHLSFQEAVDAVLFQGDKRNDGGGETPERSNPTGGIGLTVDEEADVTIGASLGAERPQVEIATGMTSFKLLAERLLSDPARLAVLREMFKGEWNRVRMEHAQITDVEGRVRANVLVLRVPSHPQAWPNFEARIERQNQQMQGVVKDAALIEAVGDVSSAAEVSSVSPVVEPADNPDVADAVLRPLMEARVARDEDVEVFLKRLQAPRNFITRSVNLAEIYMQAIAGKLSASGNQALAWLLQQQTSDETSPSVVIFDVESAAVLSVAEIETILSNPLSQIFIVSGAEATLEQRDLLQQIVDRRQIDRGLRDRLKIVYKKNIHEKIFELLLDQIDPARISVVSSQTGFLSGVNHIYYSGYLPGLALFAHALSVQNGNIANSRLGMVFRSEGGFFIYSTTALVRSLELEAQARTLQARAA